MRVMPFLVSLAPCKGMRVMLLWHDGPCVRASFTCIGLVEWACSFSDCRYLVLSCQYQPHRRKYWTQHWVQPSSPGNQCNYKTWSSWLARICILSKQKRFVRTPRRYFFFTGLCLVDCAFRCGWYKKDRRVYTDSDRKFLRPIHCCSHILHQFVGVYKQREMDRVPNL